MPGISRNNSGLSLYLSLIKYKLALAVALSGVTGYLIREFQIDADFFKLFTGIFLLASGSSVLNQFTERESDAVMQRTKNRAVASRKISTSGVYLLFSILMFTGGILLLLIGPVPFMLGCLAVFLYNLVYTVLKKVTFLAILPGALVGAIPPLIGFYSGGTGVPDNKIIFFCLFMFLWQIPHFWLLLIRYGNEYREAGFRTISDFLNERQIQFLIIIWVLLSVAALQIFSLLSEMLTANENLILVLYNLLFIIAFGNILFSNKDEKSINKAFVVFNSYSFGIMLLMIADSIFTKG